MRIFCKSYSEYGNIAAQPLGIMIFNNSVADLAKSNRNALTSQQNPALGNPVSPQSLASDICRRISKRQLAHALRIKAFHRKSQGVGWDEPVTLDLAEMKSRAKYAQAVKGYGSGEQVNVFSENRRRQAR